MRPNRHCKAKFSQCFGGGVPNLVVMNSIHMPPGYSPCLQGTAGRGTTTTKSRLTGPKDCTNNSKLFFLYDCCVSVMSELLENDRECLSFPETASLVQ